jgi:uncharacterized protein YkwD
MSPQRKAPDVPAFGVVFAATAVLLSTTMVPALAGPVAGANSCGGYVNVAPSMLKGGNNSTMVGAAQTVKALTDFQGAITCLINAERTSRGLPALAKNRSLDKAAVGHAGEAQRLKWWSPGADPHTNPETKSTIASRIQAAGYCPSPIWVSEIAYTGAGADFSSPKAAVNWWMNISTSGHREAILDTRIKEIGIGFSGQVVDPTIAPQSNMGAYVVDFGACPTALAPPSPSAPSAGSSSDNSGIVKKRPGGASDILKRNNSIQLNPRKQ